MESKELRRHFYKYIRGRCSADEIRKLLLHFGLLENEAQLKELILKQLEFDSLRENLEYPHAQRAFAKTDDALKELFAKERRLVHRRQQYRAFSMAAAILAILVIGYFMRRYLPFNGKAHPILQVTDIAPGGNNALLKINGSKKQFKLSKDKNGLAIKNGRFVYIDGSKITDGLFDQPTHLDPGPVSYTIETPRGGQYQIILSEGTKVWLNAASSLTYPISFSGNSREVFITGEAFFEIARDVSRPFKVNAKDVDMLVTGTSFNISAFDDDEKVSTTLITGGVKVLNGGEAVSLKPGQQATVTGQQGGIHVSTVDADQYTSWLRDEFSLENKTIEDIMKEVSRWYDVTVVYEKEGEDTRKFGGTYTRNKTLSALLNHLEELSGIHFTLEGRRVTVKI